MALAAMKTERPRCPTFRSARPAKHPDGADIYNAACSATRKLVVAHVLLEAFKSKVCSTTCHRVKLCAHCCALIGRPATTAAAALTS